MAWYSKGFPQPPVTSMNRWSVFEPGSAIILDYMPTWIYEHGQAWDRRFRATCRGDNRCYFCAEKWPRSLVGFLTILVTEPEITIRVGGVAAYLRSYLSLLPIYNDTTADGLESIRKDYGRLRGAHIRMTPFPPPSNRRGAAVDYYNNPTAVCTLRPAPRITIEGIGLIDEAELVSLLPPGYVSDLNKVLAPPQVDHNGVITKVENGLFRPDRSPIATQTFWIYELTGVKLACDFATICPDKCLVLVNNRLATEPVQVLYGDHIMIEDISMLPPIEQLAKFASLGAAAGSSRP